ETLVGTSAVTVDLPITSVTITPPPANIAASSHLQLEATYLPTEADASITWSLKEGSDTRVATVNASGDVTAGTRAGTVDVTATAKLTESEVAINVNPVQPAPINFDTGGHVPLELGDVLTVTTNLPAGATSLTWTYPTEKFSGETGSAANEYLLTLIQGSEDEELSESSISVVAKASHGGESPSREGTDDVIAVTNQCDGGVIYGGLCWASAQTTVANANIACNGGWRVPTVNELKTAAGLTILGLSNANYWSSDIYDTGTVIGGCKSRSRSAVNGSSGTTIAISVVSATPGTEPGFGVINVWETCNMISYAATSCSSANAGQIIYIMAADAQTCTPAYTYWYGYCAATAGQPCVVQPLNNTAILKCIKSI
ncbi:MAG: Ig-like domain-containing protein, partial [Candidatus Symbiothrix sp.]|nr:Ig-like domain-containing protein [Candidatus Symbiothrix sp.]